MDIKLQLSKQWVIGEILARWARKTPNKEALVFANRRFTYSHFNERVNRLANGLASLGIERGDKVAVLFRNCNEILECYFAVSKLGAISVPLNFRLVGRELMYQIEQSDSRALIFRGTFQDVVSSIKLELPKVENYICVAENGIKGQVDYEELIHKSSSKEPLYYVDDDDPAFIMYTAGTTGRPKGAVLTHKNLISDVINDVYETGMKISDRFLCIPPIFHSAALSLCLKLLYVGGTIIIVQEFVPEEVLRQIEKERISLTLLVPAMWISLLQQSNIPDYDTSAMKIAMTGAATMPIDVKKRIMDKFPNVGIVDTFGQTEMSPSTIKLKATDSLRKPGSVGQIMINVEARIVDDNDNDVVQGEVGEVVYRGPTLMKEYYKKPEETAESMTGGWFHSGDLVRQDEEGYIYVVGRKKDMIISGGENIYASEVEEVLFSHPKILEAAVIGMPDPQWGEAVKAIVVLRPNESLTPDEIIDFCKKNLASYKKPKSVDFVQSLPRNAAGKVLKYVLQEQYKK
jgi:fatty-acyl-CoA synthase